jgi:hypothetical protein
MSTRPQETPTDDELAAQVAEPLPDQEAMSVMGSPDDMDIVAGDWTRGDTEVEEDPER